MRLDIAQGIVGARHVLVAVEEGIRDVMVAKGFPPAEIAAQNRRIVALKALTDELATAWHGGSAQ